MMKQKHLVIGLGEVGGALASVLATKHTVFGLDKSYAVKASPSRFTKINPKSLPKTYDFLHIAFPYSEQFKKLVSIYRKNFSHSYCIVHSTVPIGTCDSLGVVHSPVNGRHDNMKKALLKYPKWFGGKDADICAMIFRDMGVPVQIRDRAEITEALKLLCLVQYGTHIALAGFMRDVLYSINASYMEIIKWNEEYNRWMLNDGNPNNIRPILQPPKAVIGGHCVLPGAKLLSKTHPSLFLHEILRYDSEQASKIWHPVNIYPSAKLGLNVSVGAFSEIGREVKIGDNVRIGAFCFIPEGVTIEDNAWIGPRVTFGNDKYPPSKKHLWAKTLVKQNAVIGAASVILPGVTIGRGAKIAMGSVVTKNVPDEEVWAGNPARLMPDSRWKLGGRRDDGRPRLCPTKSTSTTDSLRGLMKA